MCRGLNDNIDDVCHPLKKRDGQTLNRQQITGHTGLRGLAALCVFAFHLHLEEMFPSEVMMFLCRFVAWPGAAVDLFFILSGFVLCHVYAFSEGRQIHWKGYAAARVARIVPLAVAVVVFCVVLDGYSWYRYQIWSSNLLWERVLTNLLLVQGLYGNAVANSINPPSWSISVEMFLYAVIFPLLTAAPLSNRWSVCTLGLLMIGLIECYDRRIVSEDAHWLLRGVFGFSAGYEMRFCGIPERSRHLSSLMGLTAVMVMAGFLWMQALVPMVFVPVICTLCVAASVSDTWFSRLLSCSAFRWLGDRSYSIYLLHHPVIILSHRLILYPAKTPDGYPFGPLLATYIAIVGLTFIGADLSYRFFEMPLRNRVRRLAAA